MIIRVSVEYLVSLPCRAFPPGSLWPASTPYPLECEHRAHAPGDSAILFAILHGR
jgi:hypothetical protein